MDFYAIDVETANSDPASICQIGIIGCKSGQLPFEWTTYVRPADDFFFSGINVSIHGITRDKVLSAPSFPEVYPELQKILSGSIVVCHTHFDRSSLSQAAKHYGLKGLECIWLDSAQVAREAWPDLGGWGLKKVCDSLGYNFEHHNALEDAKAAAYITNQALCLSGGTIDSFSSLFFREAPKREAQSYGSFTEEDAIQYEPGFRLFSFFLEDFDKPEIQDNIAALRRNPGSLSFNLHKDTDGRFEVIHNSGLVIGYLPSALLNEISDLLAVDCKGWLFDVRIYQYSLVLKESKIPAKLVIAHDEARFIKRMVKEKAISKMTGKSLIESGYVTQEKLQEASDEALLALKGVNKGILKRIRDFSFVEEFVFLDP